MRTGTNTKRASGQTIKKDAPAISNYVVGPISDPLAPLNKEKRSLAAEIGVLRVHSSSLHNIYQGKPDSGGSPESASSRLCTRGAFENL